MYLLQNKKGVSVLRLAHTFLSDCVCGCAMKYIITLLRT